MDAFNGRPGKKTPEQLIAEFEAFHRANPQVFATFTRFANEAVNSGRPRFGAQMIIERVRWYTLVETSDPDFKINNNHAAFYTVLWQARNPGYAHLFNNRDCAATNVWVIPPEFLQ